MENGELRMENGEWSIDTTSVHSFLVLYTNTNYTKDTNNNSLDSCDSCSFYTNTNHTTGANNVNGELRELKRQLINY